MLVPFLHSFQRHAVQSHFSHSGTDLHSPCWNIIFWIQCFKGNHLFPIAIFPEGPEFPLALTHFLVTAKLATIAPSPFCVLKAPGSGSSIISALLGVKGKMVSFPRLLGQQTHISLRSIRQLPGHLRQCALCPPAARSVVDLHPSSWNSQWPGYKVQSTRAQERGEGE